MASNKRVLWQQRLKTVDRRKKLKRQLRTESERTILNEQEKEELERLRRQQRSKLEKLARLVQEEKELQLLRRQQSSKLEHLARLMQEEETQEDTDVGCENIITNITEEDHQEDVFLSSKFSMTEEKEYQEFSLEEMAMREDNCEDKVKSEEKLKDNDVRDNIFSPCRVQDENSNVIDEIELSDSEYPGETGMIFTSRGAKEDSHENLSFESSSMLRSSSSPLWSPESELKTGIKEYFEEIYEENEDKKFGILNDKSFKEDKHTSLCTLDWYNSDLNLNINTTDSCSATTMASNALDYLWAGARGTQGVTKGRACYEVRIDKNQPVLSNLRDRARETKKIIRCGWSLPSAGISLGDDKLSFGTGGTFTLCSFGGVIGCYIDLTGDPVGIKYTINGNELVGVEKVPKSKISGQALFPHIFTKNQDFTVNFGQLHQPLFPILPGFCLMNQVSGRVRGPLPPDCRAECELVMMIGLPGAGKSRWIEERLREKPEKNYNILNASNFVKLIQREEIKGDATYGRWGVELQRKCTECFNLCLLLASKQNRNYILDESNVYPTSRRKTLKIFKGFQCKAVVVVPNDEEFRRRLANLAKEKEVPAEVMINMKANFTLPDVEENFFSSVLYTELPPMKAREIVKSYNRIARSLGKKALPRVQEFRVRNARMRKRRKLSLPGVAGKTETAEQERGLAVERRPARPQSGIQFCFDFMHRRCPRSRCKFIHCKAEVASKFRTTGYLPPAVRDQVIDKAHDVYGRARNIFITM